jgi:hypothetical protein
MTGFAVAEILVAGCSPCIYKTEIDISGQGDGGAHGLRPLSGRGSGRRETSSAWRSRQF